jgi:NAD(P)-dependent dehydrogenase (short-subunit alcohol dehydrogenase family)
LSQFAAQHAVITGGGSGIGAAIAKAMAEAGARVTLLGRNAERLRNKAQELGIESQVTDVTDRGQVATAFAAAAEQNGTVTILVNNAGAAEAMPFGKMDDALWDSLIAVNLTGVYNCTKAAIGAMAEAGSGRVVNIASTAALTGYAYVSAYCAAKHGVVGLTRALALEYARKGVTVNAVCPGYTNTEIIEKAIDKIVAATGRSRDEALAEMINDNPQRRLIEPEEVAATVMWICQQESITGQAIAVAGGEVM